MLHFALHAPIDLRQETPIQPPRPSEPTALPTSRILESQNFCHRRQGRAAEAAAASSCGTGTVCAAFVRRVDRRVEETAGFRPEHAWKESSHSSGWVLDWSSPDWTIALVGLGPHRGASCEPSGRHSPPRVVGLGLPGRYALGPQGRQETVGLSPRRPLAVPTPPGPGPGPPRGGKDGYAP